MKNKIPKIIGVVLALVLVFALGAAFLPANMRTGPTSAEAGDLTWSTINVPSTTGNVTVNNKASVGPVAVSPDFANDNTVFAAVNTPGAQNVFKSTNGGHTWVSAGSASPGVNIVALAVSPGYASDSTVFFATGTTVYRSTNAGSIFGQMGVVNCVQSANITSLGVAPNYDAGGHVAVGLASTTGNEYSNTGNCVQIWGMNDVLAWQTWGVAPATAKTSNGTDVLALEFSPNYSLDTTIVVVTSDNGTGLLGDMATQDPYLRAIVGGRWDYVVPATKVNGGTTTGTQGDYDITGLAGNWTLACDIALPSDYNAQVPTLRRAYVTIASRGSVAADKGNVYRVTGATPGTAIATGAFSSANIALSNIEYSGDFASGTLIGGPYVMSGLGTNLADVWRTTNPTAAAGSVAWYTVSGAANKPAGISTNTTAWVAMSKTYVDDSTVIVGTTGNLSAFGISVDGAVSFNERGLIENNGLPVGFLGDIALSPGYGNDSTIFITANITDMTDNNSAVWVSYDGGSLWEKCLWTKFTTGCGRGVVAVSPEYATDSTLWVGDIGGTAMWSSSNGGKTWSARTCSMNIQTIAATDANIVYAGECAGTGQIAKSTNGGWTWPSSLRKVTGVATTVASLKAKDSTVLVGGDAGSIRRSDDGGATWSKVSGTLTALDVHVALDLDADIVYAASNTTGNIFRSVEGGGWAEIGVGTTAGGNCTELILTPDASLYQACKGVAAVVDIYRSVDPTAPVPVPDATFGAMAMPTSNVTAMDVVASAASNTVAFLDNSSPTTRIRMYTDILSAGKAGPGLVAPAKGSTLTRGLTTRFTIDPIDRVTRYQVLWSTDPDFATIANGLWVMPGNTTTNATALTEGAIIYWKARAWLPLRSTWSEVWTVETQVVTAVEAPRLMSPGEIAGSTTDVDINPVLNWSAFKYAIGYEMQLAKDADMTDLIADLTGGNALGNVTSWKCTETLANSTTYFWRVRAIKGAATAYSDWSAITGFTTMAKPVPPTPPIVVEPAPAPIIEIPTPETPGYIWAIIGIGAVLVIVVIVLIVRTRRPV